MEYEYKPFLIGIDMDMVSADYETPGGIFLQLWEKRLPGVKYLGCKESPHWMVEKNYHLFHQPIINKMFMKPPKGFYLRLEPMKGAIDAIKELQKIAEVVMVTTPVYEADGHNLSLKELAERDQLWSRVVTEKKEWLRNYLGKDAPPLIPLSDKTMFHGDILIDDRPGSGEAKRRKPSYIHVLYDDNYLYNRNRKVKHKMNWGTYTKVIPLVLEEVEEKRRIAA